MCRVRGSESWKSRRRRGSTTRKRRAIAWCGSCSVPSHRRTALAPRQTKGRVYGHEVHVEEVQVEQEEQPRRREKGDRGDPRRSQDGDEGPHRGPGRGEIV